MQIGPKAIGVLAVALGAAIAGAYMLGKRAEPGAATNASGAAAASAEMMPPGGAAEPNVQAPAGHPPVTEGGAPPTQGKVQVDPKAKFVHFRVGNRNVKDILSEGDVVWVGTSGGVIRYNTKTDEYKLIDTRAGLLSNGVFHLSRLDGKLAIGTYGGGLSLLDEKTGKIETFNIPDGLGDAFIYDVLKTKSGDVWIATWSGVNRVRGGDLHDRSKWDLYTVENTKGGLPNDWVYGLAEGKDGIVWLATEGGLARFAGDKWDNWNHAKGQGADYDLVKNDQAFKNDPAKVSSHHAKQKQEMGLQGIDTAYNPNYIVSLAADRDGTVWAGTWGGGLAHFDGKQFRNYTVKDGLPGNHVFMLHQSAKGDLWIGTNAGLSRRNGEKFENLTTADGLFSNTVFSMDSASDGSLWVGSFGGVTHLARRE
ncbi:MAG TPA: two-component regulator propeller domain-containing protein [Ramlibacter sp.]|nr:two-component regulator propeller domain-containing protein [Ramlibacter sp.]